MAIASEVKGDLNVTGTITSRALSIPAGSVLNASILAGAGISASKVESRFHKSYSQTGTVVAATHYIHMVYGATGEIIAFEAAITETIATGGDRTVTVDLEKYDGGWASVLTAAIELDSADLLATLLSATISDADLADGDILRVTVAVAGAAGNQALGLMVNLVLNEDPS